MINLVFDNFDEAAMGIPRELLSDDNYCYCISSRLNYKDIFITIKNNICNINIGEYGFTPGKWNHLINHYIDYDNLHSWINTLRTTKNESCTYHFKEFYNSKSGCLTSLTLSKKPNSKKKFDTAHISYRTVDFMHAMVVDFVLIHVLLNELPEDIVDVKTIYMFSWFGCITRHRAAVKLDKYFQGMEKPKTKSIELLEKFLSARYTPEFHRKLKSMEKQYKKWISHEVPFSDIPINTLSVFEFDNSRSKHKDNPNSEFQKETLI